MSDNRSWLNISGKAEIDWDARYNNRLMQMSQHNDIISIGENQPSIYGEATIAVLEGFKELGSKGNVDVNSITLLTQMVQDSLNVKIVERLTGAQTQTNEQTQRPAWIEKIDIMVRSHTALSENEIETITERFTDTVKQKMKESVDFMVEFAKQRGQAHDGKS